MERNPIFHVIETIVKNQILKIMLECKFKLDMKSHSNTWLLLKFHWEKWLLILMMNFLINFYNNILNVLWENQMNLMSMEYPKAL
jgi:hypothetical protein